MPYRLCDVHYRTLFQSEADDFAAAFRDALGRDVCLAGLKCVPYADLKGSDLHGRSFACSDFRDAILKEADLRGADFRFTDLTRADLSDCDLRDCFLEGANLRRAVLGGARIAWDQPELVAEILFQAAGRDLKKVKVASLVAAGRRRDWCWRNYFALGHPGTGWAVSVFARFVKGEDDTPAELWRRVQEYRVEKEAADE